MGRKTIHETPEQKAAAKAKYRATTANKYSTIQAPKALIEELKNKAVSLTDTFGFKPSICQTISYLLKVDTK